MVLPFIAPPSSPASFLQSDPPSATHSPAGLLSLTVLSVNSCSPEETATIFAVGPYAHETQLVSPPVFSTLTTEPSTASFTPPPEPAVHITTPSSPEVPFAQLLASSLGRTRRANGTCRKFSLSQQEFLAYSGSPGSAVSNSGTSSPFPDKRPHMGLHMGENSKNIGYEQICALRWVGSRLGSGSLTPNGWGSRLGSGTLTPFGGEPASRDSYLLESCISEVASLANSVHDSPNHDMINTRVSFELSSEDVRVCLEKKQMTSIEAVSAASGNAQGVASEDIMLDYRVLRKTEKFCEYCAGKAASKKIAAEAGVNQCHCKHHLSTSVSSKDFNFDNTKREVSYRPAISSEWWTNKKVAQELETQNNWSFFPMLQQVSAKTYVSTFPNAGNMNGFHHVM